MIEKTREAGPWGSLSRFFYAKYHLTPMLSRDTDLI